MTRADVERTLRMMEHARELSYEADTKEEDRRLIREYKAMREAIKPYLIGKKPYTEPAK